MSDNEPQAACVVRVSINGTVRPHGGSTVDFRPFCMPERLTVSVRFDMTAEFVKDLRGAAPGLIAETIERKLLRVVDESEQPSLYDIAFGGGDANG